MHIFKQERHCLANYRFLKLLLGITKLNPSLNVCVIFDFRNIAIACRLKSFTKTFNGDFRPFLPPGNILKRDRFVDIIVLFLNM